MQKQTGSGFEFGPKEWEKPTTQEESWAQQQSERRKKQLRQKGQELEPSFASAKNRIITAILKEALPMMVLDPTKVEMKWIVKALREEFGLDSSSKILWKQYMTFREGASNKYHYFVVFKDGDQFHAANAYGRIGYPARVNDIGTFDSESEAKGAAQTKADSKLAKGYEVTKVE